MFFKKPIKDNINLALPHIQLAKTDVKNLDSNDFIETLK